MTERVLVQGNEAIALGALHAGCQAFFGYPITPQNEIPEWFAREFPGRGRVFVQSQSETGSINMVYGAAASGMRAMTSTSSPGWSLMQETMSHLAGAEVPCVVVVVSRGGPGGGSVRHSQMDYLSATRGAHGGYKNIVLCPSTVQEAHDLVQLAFHLADKYSHPVVLLTDGLTGQLAEMVQAGPLDFGPRPEKDWAVKGKSKHPDGRKRLVHSGVGVLPRPPYYFSYGGYLEHIDDKYRRMARDEVRCETYRLDGASLVVVAFGYVARSARQAVDLAREEGLPVGLARPVTAWPFPERVIREGAQAGARFLVAEDNLGQMVDDVRAAAGDPARVTFMGMLSRHVPNDGGMLFPDAILAGIRKLV